MFRRIKRLFYMNKGKVVIYLGVIVLFILSFLYFAFSIIRLNGIETILRIIILFLLILYGLYFVTKTYNYMVNKNHVRYYLFNALTFIASICLTLVAVVITTIYGEIGNLVEKDTSLYTGYMISMKDTSKNDIKDVGIINNKDDIEGYEIANLIIKDEKLNVKTTTYDTYEEMLYDLYKGKINGAFVQSNYVSYFSSNDADDYFYDIENATKIVYKKSKKEKNKDLTLASNKTLEEPFTILLLGVDSTENTLDAASSFNGDTLMLITFNPHTLNATIFSIPRDLYVPISCRKGSEAKINSSSAGGVTCVINTIKDLTGIDIDYYAKINFRGVVDLVEALGGIDVEVTYKFCEQDSNRDFTNQICLDKGYQHLNGEQTLAYARHRHTLPGGDLQRIQNQQLIVEAMAKKLMNLNALTDFKDILSSVSKNVATNLSRDQILSSYNILKDILINMITDKEAIAAQKAYLEVYDLKVYNPKTNSYSAALGYYEDSLKDIVSLMRTNLELEKGEVIKEFTFDANTPYEIKVAGKGIKNTIDVPKVPSFVGKMVSEAETWGLDNNITINKEYVTQDSPLYNKDISNGLVGNQSIKEGASLKNVTSLTIYINTVAD